MSTGTGHILRGWLSTGPQSVDGVTMYGDIVDSEDMGAEARQVATEMGWPVEEQERERA